jgi:DtxR family transcriptional regulator, Mn-dependent transcriptional regulator
MMTDQINDTSLRRFFEIGGLTHSSAHYLTAIERLRGQNGYARVTDVAQRLGISRGAASRAISVLKERGWIEEDPHRMLLLTEGGRELALMVERNYRVVEGFLEEVLGIPGDVAREDACKMEHLLSPVTAGSLLKMIRLLEGNRSLMRRLKEELKARPPARGDGKFNSAGSAVPVESSDRAHLINGRKVARKA